ncbi:MAG: hypothetical protein RSE47_04085 [Acidaminococcaceae bacterium]
MKNEDKQPSYKKPPGWVEWLLYGYALLWITMMATAGLSSLAMGRVDYNSVSMVVALTLGIYFILKFFEKHNKC